MHKIGCRRKYNFPIEYYMMSYRCDDTGALLEREGNTNEYVKQCAKFIREVSTPFMAAKFSKYVKRATGFSYGRNRCVLIMNSYVIKFPITFDGHADNDWEGSISSTDESYIQMARTRLAYVDHTPVVFMELVKQAKESYEQLPDWVGSVDCKQVGYNRKGKLVAYDYGCR